MPRHDRKVNGAALGDFAHGASARTFGNATDQGNTCRIGQGLKKNGIEKRVERAAARGGLPGCGGRAFFAYLRHHASIDFLRSGVKPRVLPITGRRDSRDGHAIDRQLSEESLDSMKLNRCPRPPKTRRTPDSCSVLRRISPLVAPSRGLF